MTRDNTDSCRCPYCDGEKDKDQSLCAPCSAKVERCPECGAALPRGQKTCPACAGRPQSGQGRNKK